MQPYASPLVLRPGEGRSIDLGNFRMSVKVAGAETGGVFSLLEATEPPGFGPPMHIHHDCAEAFYVLEGEYRIFIEGVEHRCPAGSFILIPGGLRHGFRFRGQYDEELKTELETGGVEITAGIPGENASHKTV